LVHDRNLQFPSNGGLLPGFVELVGALSLFIKSSGTKKPYGGFPGKPFGI